MKKYTDVLLVLIGVSTFLSGWVLIVIPDLALTLLSAQTNHTTGQLFATVGMFMVLFWGMLTHSIYSHHTDPVVLLWCAFQKFASFAAVTIGVVHQVWSLYGEAIAIFDLLCGIIIFTGWRAVKENS